MLRSPDKFYWLLSLTAFIWGAQAFLVKMVVREITPVTLTGARYLLISGTLSLILLCRKERHLLPPKRCLLPLAFMGLTGITLNNVAQFTGLQYSTVTNATLIATLTPAVTAMLAVVFVRERLLPLQWFGIVISLCGTLYLVTRGSLDVLLHISFNVGDVLFFAAQFGWAAYSLVGVRVMRELPPLPTTIWAGLFGALITIAYGLVTGELARAPLSAAGTASFMYIVWIGGVCAMVFWNLSVKAVGASQAAIFLNIMPLVGILTGVVFLHEPFHIRECFGAAAILSGVYLITHARQLLHWRNRRYRVTRRRLAR